MNRLLRTSAGLVFLLVGAVLNLVSGQAACADSWASVTSMPTARYDLAAATAWDGRIFVLGGSNGGDYPNTVEAYDPDSNTWTTVAPMPTPRAGLAAVTGLDGRIYTFGGENSNGTLHTVEIYDPSSNSWTTGASMPTARCFIAAAMGLDGKIYVIGGTQSGSTNSALNTVEAYDPASNIWAPVTPMLTPRAVLAAVTGLDGKIYAIGGSNSGGGGHLNTVEAYDPSTNTWAAVASLSEGRYNPAAAVGGDGTIYVMGGATAQASGSNSVEAYDPVANQWITVASMPTARYDLAAATGLDGRIYAFGGYSGNYNGNVLGTAEVYTPTILISPSVVAGSLATTGTITLNVQAPSGGVFVTLTNTNPKAIVPRSVTVQEGQLSQDFTVKTYAVSESISGTVTATYNGHTSTAVLTVRPIGVASLTIGPSSVVGGFETATGTLTLEAPAEPASIPVSLTSSDPSAATVQTRLNFSLKQQVRTFRIKTGFISADTPVTITATANGTSASADLTVQASTITKLKLLFSPRAPRSGYPRGTVITLTATLKDASGNPVSNQSVTLDQYVQDTRQTTLLTTGTTDSNGQISVSYTVPTDASETKVYIKASFSGSSPYRESSASQQVPIG